MYFMEMDGKYFFLFSFFSKLLSFLILEFNVLQTVWYIIIIIIVLMKMRVGGCFLIMISGINEVKNLERYYTPPHLNK